MLRSLKHSKQALWGTLVEEVVRHPSKTCSLLELHFEVISQEPIAHRNPEYSPNFQNNSGYPKFLYKQVEWVGGGEVSFGINCGFENQSKIIISCQNLHYLVSIWDCIIEVCFYTNSSGISVEGWLPPPHNSVTYVCPVALGWRGRVGEERGKSYVFDSL